MLMILSRIQCSKHLAQAMAVSLLVIGAAFLVACADDENNQAAEGPQATATSAGGSTSDQPGGATPTTEPASADASTPSGPPIQVVTTSNIVADWAVVVGGDRVEVFSMLPPGSDPHTFVPGTRDVAKIADADFVLSIGLGLEAGWLEELLHNASADESTLVALGDGVDPLESSEADAHDDHADDDEHMGEEDDDHADEDGEHMGEEEGDHHDHGPLDPHFWFDPNRVKIAVNEIAARYSTLDPGSAGLYFQNAAAYAAELDELHSWIEEHVELVPPERRLLVTSHDTFSYLADVYGFEVIGLLIPSVATHAEPSAEHIADVVSVVREHGAPAVFSETTVSGKLPEAVARETGAVLVQLYTDSLGEEGSAAGTYLGMVRTNVERIVEALQ